MKLFLALGFSLFLLAGCANSGSGGGSAPPPTTPLPPEPPPAITARRGYFLGYFGSDDAQVGETADHVTLLCAFWGSDDALALRISTAQLPTILDMSDLLWDGAQLKLDAAPGIRARLTCIKALGALSYVRWIYVKDEPDLAGISDSDMLAACSLLRSVMAFFPELGGCGLHVCYSSHGATPGISAVDLVGVDDYGQYEGVLGGTLQMIKAKLRVEQQVALYPGCAQPWRQNPYPFFDYANNDPQVGAIIAFTWVGYEGNAALGLRNDTVLQPHYRVIGAAIKAVNPPVVARRARKKKAT